jgi:hypothetical protein
MASEEEDYVDIQKNSGGSGEEDDRDPTIEELMAELEADSDMTAFDQLLEKAANRVTSTNTKSEAKPAKCEKSETDTTGQAFESAPEKEGKPNKLESSADTQKLAKVEATITEPHKIKSSGKHENSAVRSSQGAPKATMAKEPPAENSPQPARNNSRSPVATSPKKDAGGLSVIGSLWASAVASATSVKASAEEIIRERDLSLKVIPAQLVMKILEMKFIKSSSLTVCAIVSPGEHIDIACWRRTCVNSIRCGSSGTSWKRTFTHETHGLLWRASGAHCVQRMWRRGLYA